MIWCGGGGGGGPAGCHLGRKGVAAVHAAQGGCGAGTGGGVGGARGFRRDRDVSSKASVLAEAVCAAAGAGYGTTHVGLGGRGGGSGSGGARGQAPGFDGLNGLFVSGGAVHAEEEVVLVLDEKDQDILAQFVLVGRHVMLGMGEHSGLEYGGQVGGGHAVLVGLGGEYGQEIQDIQEQLLVQGRQVPNQLLIGGNGLGVVVDFGLGGGDDALGLALIDAQWLAKLFVKIQGHDRFRQLVQIATEDVGGIVHGVTGPVQTFPVAFGGVEYFLEVLDALRGTVKAEDAFDVGC